MTFESEDRAVSLVIEALTATHIALLDEIGAEADNAPFATYAQIFDEIQSSENPQELFENLLAAYGSIVFGLIEGGGANTPEKQQLFLRMLPLTLTGSIGRYNNE